MSRWWGKNIEIDGSWLLLEDGNYLRRGVSLNMWGTTQSWLTTSAESWESSVQQVLRSIEGSRAGSLLLGLINSPDVKKCKIIPIQPANFKETRVRPLDWSKALKSTERLGACPNNDFCSSTHGAGVAPHSKLVRGTGEGSSVRLHYHPGAWLAPHQMAGVDGMGLADMAQDDVLFHELIHVYRAQRGVFESQSTGNAFEFLEEFYAVVLTNIYVSEMRPHAVMRGDHSLEFHSLKDAGQPEDAAEFYRRNRNHIDKLMNDESMSALTTPLSSIHSTNRIGNWNPLRTARMNQAFSSL